MNPLAGDYKAYQVLEGWRVLYLRALPLATEEARRRHPRGPDEDEALYEQSLKARAFDVCRGLLPFGAATQVAWGGSLRHVGERLGVLAEHPSAEVRDVAAGLLVLCRERYPHSGFDGEAAAISGVGKLTEREEAREARRAWSARVARDFTYVPEEDPGFPSDTMAVKAGRVAFHTTVCCQAAKIREVLKTRPRGAPIPPVLEDLGQLQYDFLIDCGSWRDLQRHRVLKVRPTVLTADHGFEPWYLEQLPGALPPKGELAGAPGVPHLLDGFAGEVAEEIRRLTRAAETLTSDPVVRQYYLAMGYRMLTRVTGGLPGTVYMLELRSGKRIHPTLRRRVLEMARLLHAAHPEIALHPDTDPGDWDATRGAATITERRST